MSQGRLAEASSAVLVVVDVQEKMLRAVTTRPPDQIVASIRKLIGAARILDVPVLYTEQNPSGLGTTVAALRDALDGAVGPLVKSTCSCWRDEGFRSALQQSEREHVILVGLETHVCILQTALDLVRMDYVPFVPADAVGSRCGEDMAMALARMPRSGVEIGTTEGIIFELVERCDHPRFKDVLKIIK